MSSPEECGFDAPALKGVGEALTNRIAAGRFPGAVVYVERRGQQALFEALGSQDPARAIPMRRGSIFRIYSMTKPIVSVALMQFAECGRVLLRDPVSKFLPEFADAGVGVERVRPRRPMTVHDLLRHTSGLTYEFLAPSPVREMYTAAALYSRRRDNAELVRELAALPLMHQPGSVWDYSRATDVLGRLVEVLADRPLGEHLERAIFEPLGMVDTGFGVPPAQHHRIAEPFAQPPEGVTALVPVYDARAASRLQSGGGGLASTASDYASFLRMLLAGGRAGTHRMLGRKTVEFMTVDHLGPIPREGELLPPGHGFGLGFAVKTSLGEHTEPGSIGSYGWSGAAATAFFVDPAEDLFAIVLTQAPGLLDEVRELFRQSVYAALD